MLPLYRCKTHFLCARVSLYFLCLQIGAFVRTPCIKFVAETASFFTFLTMIVGNSFAERDKLCDTSLADDPLAQEYWSHVGANVTARYSVTNTCIRNHKPEPLQITLSLWICGECIFIFIPDPMPVVFNALS